MNKSLRLLALVAVCLFCVRPSTAQATCNCVPAFVASPMRAPRTVSFHGDWSALGPQKDQIINAFQQWNIYWADHGDNVEFIDVDDNVSADITIQVVDHLSNPNWDAQTNVYGGGYGDMFFLPQTLAGSNLWRAAVHEFGHALGLGDIYGCPDSAMSNPPYSFGVTNCDYERMNATYPGDESPVIIDMTGGGLACSSAPNGVIFDIRSTGTPVRVAWPLGTNVAFLVRDLNHNGLIDDSSEMFGNHTIMPSGQVAPDGYTALSALDDDHNEYIDAADAVFADLLLWRDLNRNGVTEFGELQLVSDSTITKIRASANYYNYIDQWANWFPFWSTVETNVAGVFLTSADVFLKVVQP